MKNYYEKREKIVKAVAEKLKENIAKVNLTNKYIRYSIAYDAVQDTRLGGALPTVFEEISSFYKLDNYGLFAKRFSQIMAGKLEANDNGRDIIMVGEDAFLEDVDAAIGLETFEDFCGEVLRAKDDLQTLSTEDIVRSINIYIDRNAYHEEGKIDEWELSLVDSLQWFAESNIAYSYSIYKDLIFDIVKEMAIRKGLDKMAEKSTRESLGFDVSRIKDYADYSISRMAVADFSPEEMGLYFHADDKTIDRIASKIRSVIEDVPVSDKEDSVVETQDVETYMPLEKAITADDEIVPALELEPKVAESQTIEAADVNEFIDMKYKRQSNADRAMRNSQKNIMQRYAEYKKNKISVGVRPAQKIDADTDYRLAIYEYLKAQIAQGQLPSEIVEDSILAHNSAMLIEDLIRSGKIFTKEEIFDEIKRIVDAKELGSF